MYVNAYLRNNFMAIFFLPEAAMYVNGILINSVSVNKTCALLLDFILLRVVFDQGTADDH